MIYLVHTYAPRVASSTGSEYGARAYASARTDGTWEAWLVFFPVGGGRALPTDRESTQPNLDAVAYWASGLTPAYLEGALQRALDLRPEARLARRAMAAAREEALAEMEAGIYERAAREARLAASDAALRKDIADRAREMLGKT